MLKTIYIQTILCQLLYASFHKLNCLTCPDTILYEYNMYACMYEYMYVY